MTCRGVPVRRPKGSPAARTEGPYEARLDPPPADTRLGHVLVPVAPWVDGERNGGGELRRGEAGRETLDRGAALTFAPDGRSFRVFFTDRPTTTSGWQRQGTWNGRRQGRQTRYQR